MAISKPLIPILTLLVIIIAYDSTPAVALGGAYGRFVGRRTEIKDVKSNQEVQDLGRFSVEEFNRQRRMNGEYSSSRLTFKEVVKAESQVISGLKYYMKVSASQGGSKKLFDSVVVVRPWIRAKKLVGFEPSDC